MKTLLQLGERDCRWPLGRPEHYFDGEQRFCARRALPGKPYCRPCCNTAYQPREAKAVEPDEKLAA